MKSVGLIVHPGKRSRFCLEPPAEAHNDRVDRARAVAVDAIAQERVERHRHPAGSLRRPSHRRRHSNAQSDEVAIHIRGALPRERHTRPRQNTNCGNNSDELTHPSPPDSWTEPASTTPPGSTSRSRPASRARSPPPPGQRRGRRLRNRVIGLSPASGRRRRVTITPVTCRCNRGGSRSPTTAVVGCVAGEDGTVRVAVVEVWRGRRRVEGREVRRAARGRQSPRSARSSSIRCVLERGPAPRARSGLQLTEWPQSESRMTICSERLHGLVVEQRLSTRATPSWIATSPTRSASRRRAAGDYRLLRQPHGFEGCVAVGEPGQPQTILPSRTVHTRCARLVAPRRWAFPGRESCARRTPDLQRR